MNATVRQMETFDAIKARRKVEKYDDAAIPDEVLEQILEAGRRSPSSRNQQRWTFVLVNDRNTLERLSHVWRGAAHIAQAAAAVAVAAPPGDDPKSIASINFDLGQAMMSMQIAATDLGVGTRHASVEDWELGAEILGLPNEWRLSWMVGLGYPGDRPIRPIENPNRKSFDEVVHWNRWGG